MSNGTGPTQAEMDRQSRKWAREERQQYGDPPFYEVIIAAGGINPKTLITENDFLAYQQKGEIYDRLRAFLDEIAEEAHKLLIEVEGQFTYERKEGSSVDGARFSAEEYAMERSMEIADDLVYNLTPRERWGTWVLLELYDFPGQLKETAQFSMAERGATPTLAMAEMMHYDLIEFAQTAIYDLSTENLPPE